MKPEEKEKYIKAGKIHQEVTKYAKELIKPGMKLLEIAQKVEGKIYELGAKPAFPVNLSINEVAAHFHPTLEDETEASGLLKVDIGIHIDGFIADSAFTLDLTEDNRHKTLIEANQKALDEAIKKAKDKPTLNELGKTIQNSIEESGFSPIVNLSGHGLGEWEVHVSPTIPNYENGNETKLTEGAFAIEPFATTGEGKVIEGPGSNIYQLEDTKNVRSPLGRKILDWLNETKQTLPFSLRELQEKFGPMSRLALREMEQLNIIHHFPQLIEKSKKPVSQAEHTILITKDDFIVTTRD